MHRLTSTSGTAGFTLPEVLLAAAIITIAFVGLLTVIPYSTSAVQSGNQTSTATFLANQKLEEAKNMPWTTTPANDCLGIGPSSAPIVPAGSTCTLGATTVAGGAALPWAADQGSTAIAGFSGYSRTVRVTNCAVTPCTTITDAGMRLVTVNVSFQPVTNTAAQATSKTVSLSMVIAQR
jgi:prepilin-type N-terminal cleavage/methylation domain-containing protein